MADETTIDQTTPSDGYKFGQSVLDYDTYINNLSNNVQSYVASKNWSEGEKEAFIKAYLTFKDGLIAQKASNYNRLYTDEFGTIYDNDRVIDENQQSFWVDQNGALYDSQDDIKKRRDRKKATNFSAYRELASYANIIGKGILDAIAARDNKPDEESDSNGSGSNKFSFDEHGFIPYWAGQINPAGGEFDPTPFINMDALDETTKTRGQAKRAAYVQLQLLNYINQLGHYDFSDTPYKTSEAYKAKVLEAMHGLDDGKFDDQDAINFQAIGIMPDWYSTFFTTKLNPNTTDEEIALQEEVDKQKALDDALTTYDNDFFAKKQDLFNKAPIYHRQNNAYVFPTSPRINVDLTQESNIRNLLTKWYGYKFPDFKKKSGETDEQRDKRINAAAIKIENLFVTTVLDRFKRYGGNTYIQINGKHTSMQVALELVMALIANEEERTLVPRWEESTGTKLGTNIWFYNNDAVKDNQTLSVLVWDKNTNKLYYTWAGYIPESKVGKALLDENAKGRNAILTLQSNTPTHTTWDNFITTQKNGGALTLQYGGHITQSDYGVREAEEAKKRTANLDPFDKPDAERVRLGNREIGATPLLKGLTQTAENPEAPTWKFEDYTRLAGIGTDVVSMFLDPLSGAVAGVGSTVMHTAADLMDDSVSGWQTFKNTVTSLGLDAVALIPGMEGMKIIRELQPFAKKLIKAVTYGATAAGAAGTAMNSGEIVKSLLKLTSDPRHLTVNDWLNIAQAIMGVTGTARTGKAHVQQHLVKKLTKVNDQVGVGITHADGTKEDIILQGEHAAKMREFQKKHDVEGANKYLQTLEGFEGATVGSTFKGLQKPSSIYTREKNRTAENGKDTWDNGWAPASDYVKQDLDIFDIYDPTQLKKRTKYRANVAVGLADRGWNATDMTHALTHTEVDALQQKLVEDFLKANGLIAARNESNLNIRKERINKTKASLDKSTTAQSATSKQLAAERITNSNLKTKLAELTTKNAKANTLITRTDLTIANKLSLLADLLDKTKNPGNFNKKGELKASAKALKAQLELEIDQLKQRKANLEKAYGNNVLQDINDKVNNSNLQIFDLKNRNAVLTKEIANIKARLARILPTSTTWVDASGKTHNLSFSTERLRDAVQRTKTIDIKDADNRVVRKNVKLDWNKIMKTAGFDGAVPLEYSHGLFKNGGNLARVRFMLGGGDTPQEEDKKAKDYKTEANDALTSFAAKQGLTVYNGTSPINYNLDYNLQGARNWVDFSNATKADWASDAAYLELLKTNPDELNSYFNEDGTLKKDLISRFTENLYKTQAFQDYTNYLKLKSGDTYNAVNYFKSIAFNENAPLEAKDYASRQLKYIEEHPVMTDLDWTKVFTARYDHKPGTYHYTPGFSQAEKNYIYNQVTKAFDPVENFNKDEYEKLNSYYKDEDNTRTVSNYFVKKNPTDAPVNSPGNGSGNDKPKPKVQIPVQSMDLIRVLSLNAKNANISNKSLAEERPFLEQPREFQLPIYGNLRAVLEGNSAAARLNSIARQTNSSDASLNRATSLAAVAQGNDYIEAGNKADDEMIRTTADKSIALTKENMQNRTDVANQNLLQEQNTDSNILRKKLANESQAANNWDMYWQGVILEAKNKSVKWLKAQLTHDLQALLTDFKKDPLKYADKYAPGYTFGNEFRSTLNGTMQYSTDIKGKPTEKKYLDDMDKYKEIMEAAAAEMLGLTPWDYETAFNDSVFHPNINVPKEKSGGKVSISKERIKEKMKNADRFHDSVKHLVNSHDKKMERISKSLYSRPKGKII